MRAGKFSVNVALTSTRGLVAACVRAVQPAVIIPINSSIDASVPERVRAAARRCLRRARRSDGPYAPPQVLTDDLRVRQIIMNGLTNAVKYSNAPENGAITVMVHTGPLAAAAGDDIPPPPNTTGTSAIAVAVRPPPRREQWLFIDVLDHGPGLQGVDEKLLFSDFAAPVQLARPSLHSTHGTSDGFHVGSSGVGLPICSRCGLRDVRVTVCVLLCVGVLHALLLAPHNRRHRRTHQDTHCHTYTPAARGHTQAVAVLFSMHAA